MPDVVVAERCPQCGGPLPAGSSRLTCQYCGTSLSRRKVAEASGSGGGQTPATEEPAVKDVSYVDQQTGLEVFRMQIPGDWEYQAMVQWQQNPANPAPVFVRIFNPQGQENVEYYSPIYFVHNGMLSSMGKGSNYFGYEVRPPISALQCMREIIVPRYRAQASQIREVQTEPRPDIIQAIQAQRAPNAPVYNRVEGLRVRLSYKISQDAFEEDYMLALATTEVPVPGMFGTMKNTFWFLQFTTYRALAGELDAVKSDLMDPIAKSFQVNQAWAMRIWQISQQMTQAAAWGQGGW